MGGQEFWVDLSMSLLEQEFGVRLNVEGRLRAYNHFLKGKYYFYLNAVVGYNYLIKFK